MNQKRYGCSNLLRRPDQTNWYIQKKKTPIPGRVFSQFLSKVYKEQRIYIFLMWNAQFFSIFFRK